LTVFRASVDAKKQRKINSEFPAATHAMQQKECTLGVIYFIENAFFSTKFIH
jgi:hypothetical protein